MLIPARVQLRHDGSTNWELKNVFKFFAKFNRNGRYTVLDGIEQLAPGPFVILSNWFQQPHSEVKQE